MLLQRRVQIELAEQNVRALEEELQLVDLIIIERRIERLDKGARMSEAVIHGNTVYLAGQVAEGPDVESQTKAVLASPKLNP